jgi:hypothetical protein
MVETDYEVALLTPDQISKSFGPEADKALMNRKHSSILAAQHGVRPVLGLEVIL